MKKYLMTSVAALALCAGFTSCSHDEFEPYSQSEIVQKNYEAAFVSAFGQPASSQTWGFGQTLSTRANPGTDVYPATHEYKDADSTVIAGANMSHDQWANPNEGFGGWLVPDPLREGQKLRVQRYFQTHPYLGYEDPHFRHFFVQQVYKGGSDQQGVSKENIVAAGNSTYTSSNMNQLTVGVANSHINDFNSGTCSTSNVLQNDGTTKPDQITLMVNVYDTSCFGYHDSGSSTHHNDKMALASAAVIDAWADSLKNATGETIGEAVVDKWNRSFMGFDLAIKEGAQAYATDNAGNVLYATYDQAPEIPENAWDGEKIIKITTGKWVKVTIQHEYYTEIKDVPVYKDEFKSIMGCAWLTTNENFYVGEKVTLDQSFQVNGTPADLDGIKNAVILKEFTVDGIKYQSVINLPRIKQLVDAGYLPVKDKSLQDWIKVGKSDGYFSDWIVTLTEAKRNIPDEKYDIRVIGEDLSAGGEKSDFDFNDVVFDVKFGANAKINLLAAGGTLPLCISVSEGSQPTASEAEKWEVHNLFKVAVDYMVNTNAQLKGLKGNDRSMKAVELPLGIPVANAAEANSKIKVYVKKSGEWVELKAIKGKAASKVAVGTDYDWCDEREDVDAKYFGSDDTRFTKYVGGQYYWNTWYKK